MFGAPGIPYGSHQDRHVPMSQGIRFGRCGFQFQSRIVRGFNGSWFGFLAFHMAAIKHWPGVIMNPIKA